MISLICILLSFIFLGLDTFGIPSPSRFKFQSAGLAFGVLSIILGRTFPGV